MTDRCDKCGAPVIVATLESGETVQIHGAMLRAFEFGSGGGWRYLMGKATGHGADDSWTYRRTVCVDHADVCPARPGAYDLNHLPRHMSRWPFPPPQKEPE